MTALASLPTASHRLLRVGGDHRGMGIQQGAALASDIRKAESVLLRSEPFRVLRPRLVPFRLFAALARRRASALLAPHLARHLPAQHERLLGISDGAGISVPSTCLLHGAEMLLATIDWRHRPAALAACSAAAVRGPRARDGVAIHKNFDYPAFAAPLFVVRESRPSRGLGALELTAAPFSGAIDGINEAGLAIAYDYGFSTDASCEPLPLTLAISAALERCTRAAQAADYLSSRPRGGGALLLVSDASGDLLSLELSPTRSAVRRPLAGEDALLHTNLYSTEALREVEIPRGAVYSSKNVAALRGQRIHASAERREAALAALLAARPGPLDGQDLQALFADHGGTAAGDDGTLCRHGPYWSTTAMIQLFPRDRRLRIAFDAPCRARPADFTL